MASQPFTQPTAHPKAPVPPPVTTDLEGLIDVDHRFRAALAAWNQLTPEQRRRFNREVWLAKQARDRRYAADQAKAYDARQAAVAARRVADAEAVSAVVRASTCGTCFTVRTPAGNCNCSD